MSRKLTVIQRRLLLSVHILTSVAWIGVGLCLLALVLFAASASDTGIFQAAYRIADLLHRSIFIPLAVVTAITGIALSAFTQWRFLRFYWIIMKEVVIVFVIGSGVLIVGAGPISRGLGTMIQLASVEGLNALHNPVFLINQNLLLAYFALQVVLISASAIVSVFKPFRRRKHQLMEGV